MESRLARRLRPAAATAGSLQRRGSDGRAGPGPGPRPTGWPRPGRGLLLLLLLLRLPEQGLFAKSGEVDFAKFHFNQ